MANNPSNHVMLTVSSITPIHAVPAVLEVRMSRAMSVTEINELAERLNMALMASASETPADPLAKRCYVMSEPHLSGYRVVIGFAFLQDASEAHQWIVDRTRGAPEKAGGDAS